MLVLSRRSSCFPALLLLLWLASSAQAALPCALPEGTAPVARSTPDAQDLDPEAVQEAIAFALERNRFSVKIHRHGCLVGESPLDPITDRLPYEVFSSTKSVNSMLVGIARDRGLLDLDAPIDVYLPEGLGDAEHRALTIRQILSQNTGLTASIFGEAGTVGTDTDIVQKALALPFEHQPGTWFEYAQNPLDLLPFLVEQVTGEDYQEFAQRELFGPIGIPRDHWSWERDRSGHTYGYAWLVIPSADYARLGLLLENEGSWNGQQILSSDYIDQLRVPTPTNGCYGFLFWVNGGDTCVTATAGFERRELDRRFIPSAPPDLYGMVGAFQQVNFVIPSLDMVVSMYGFGGDRDLDPNTLASALGGDLFHEFFRILMRGVRDQQIADPGPYPSDGPNLDPADDFDADPLIPLGAFGFGPYAPEGCSFLECGGQDLSSGSVQSTNDKLNLLLGLTDVADLLAALESLPYAPVDQPGPPLQVPQALLDASLACTPDLAGAGRAPVLLVHGTTVTPEENWDWNWAAWLEAQGWPYCTVRLPNRAMSDIQVSAEYVVHALRAMHAESGRRVQVLGHSQGGHVPRWALRFWPDTRAMVDDLVSFAAPNHGSVPVVAMCVPDCAPAIWQQAHQSKYMQALNSHQETFAGIDYTTIYTHADEFVQPNLNGFGTSSLEREVPQPNAVNVATQDLCPLNAAEHLLVGTSDPVAFAIAFDALTHDGPADPARVGGAACLEPFMPGVDPLSFAVDFATVGASIGQTLASYPHVSAEPPLQPYVLPEPARAAGLGAGALALGWLASRRRRRA